MKWVSAFVNRFNWSMVKQFQYLSLHLVLSHFIRVCLARNIFVFIIRWYATQWHNYHLLISYESYFFFLSVRILFNGYLKNEINNRLRIFTVSMSSTGIVLITSFHVITQPWRQRRAILCFHLIMNIFITMLHKLPNFCTHKLQMISQHTDNPCPRARHDAHVRARQNFKMLKITYKQFWVRTRSFRAFQNVPSVPVRARVVRAHSARKKSKFHFFFFFFFCRIWIPLTIIDKFHSFAFTLDLS